MKHLLLEKAKRRIVLMDSSKVGEIFPYKIGDFSQVDVLISDGNLPQEVVEMARKAGTTVL